MDTYDDDLEFEDQSLEDYYLQTQAQINSLEGWKLEGSVGRAMMDAIKSGRCCLGFEATHDYWGNRIPSRSEIQEGSFGSIGYVVRQYGQEWADKIAAVTQTSALAVFSRSF